MKNKNTLNELTPEQAFHPGEDLKDELDARNISQGELARKLGMKKSQINEIIRGKRNITANLAILLEDVLGIDADYWMNAQKQYELDKARIDKKLKIRQTAIKEWENYKDKIAIRFLRKQGFIIDDPVKDIHSVKKVYNIKKLSEINEIYSQQKFKMFRKSDSLKIDPVNLIGWVKLVEYKAKEENPSTFLKEKRKELIKKLIQIINQNSNTQQRVKETLLAFGIVLIYQKKGEKTPVDGISFWSGQNPAIGMTLRHKRIDNFTFTLFHELGHIFKHLLNNKKAEFIDLNENSISQTDIKDKENEANVFARESLIPKEKWERFFQQNNRFSDTQIKNFAKEINIHPAIVHGRLCFETKNYRRSTQIDFSIR
jgi:HTH-type transcriptional regulator/antitoxin HigA